MYIKNLLFTKIKYDVVTELSLNHIFNDLNLNDSKSNIFGEEFDFH